MSRINIHTQPLINNASGNAVLHYTLDIAKQVFNSRLLACYALGSLAHGGFSDLVSDVDMAIILEDPVVVDDADKISSIQQNVKQSDLPLAERLSIFWGSIYSLQHNAHIGRFPPLDKLDLIENGKLLTGSDIRGKLTKPTHADLIIMGAKFALQMLGSAEITEDIKHPALLYKKGIRQLTKTILFPVRLLYTCQTGKIGHNGEAVEYYMAANQGSNAQLVVSAFNWRHIKPESADEVVQLLNMSLINLYVQFINEYHTKMLEYNEIGLAKDLVTWRDALLSEYI